MRKRIIQIFSSILCLLFTNCYPETDTTITPQYEGKKLVVLGFFTPSEVIKLEVLRTLPTDIRQDTAAFKSDTVRNATVKLFENDVFVENLLFQKGFYLSPSGLKPKPNYRYRVEVSAPDFPTVYSRNDTIPREKPNWAITSWRDSASLQNGYVNGRIQVTFSINQQPAYFGLLQKTFWRNQKPQFNDFLIAEQDEFVYLGCEKYENTNFGLSNLVLSDRCAVAKKVDISAFTVTYFNNGIGIYQADSACVYAQQFSPFMFKYLQSQALQKLARSLFIPSNSNVFTNIENGYGMIGCYQLDSLTLKIR